MKNTLLCLFLIPLPVLAQYKCTMPNGVVVVKRLSACHSDAVKSEALTGADALSKPPEYKFAPPKPYVDEPKPVEKKPDKLDALIVALRGLTDDVRATAAKTDVKNLMMALKLYKLDNQRYPTAAQGLQALLTKPTEGPIPTNWKHYLDKLPNDPWGSPYQYLNPGVRAQVDVLSFGADGQPGGEGKNADIGN